VSIVAIITARGGSKRIPKKNIREFLGKPIIAYSIKAALESGIFDEIMVSTDSQEIAEISKQYGATVPFFRSNKTSDDIAGTDEVLKEVINEYKRIGKNFDNLCCIYPCAPLITADKINIAYRKFIETNCNSLLPVVKFSYPIQRALKANNDLISFRESENIELRSQELESMFHDAGMFYFMKSASLIEYKNIFTPNTRYIELNEAEVQDIDNETDWELAELKYKIMNKELTDV